MPASVASDPARPVRSDPVRTLPTVPGPSIDRSAGHNPANPVLRPKKFGRYYLVDRLGEGGMAEIYTAVAFGAEHFRRTFVVKLLHSNAQRTPALVEMFIDEANLASNLIHSNVIPVYDFGKMGEEYFMAQEYVLGRDLRKFVTASMARDKRPLDPRLAVHIAREALRGMEYAHTRQTDEGRPLGIVHRDVSPNNILVSARGEVKLLDFGIAISRNRLTHTQIGVVKGNVGYMAPEQAHGTALDARTDIASVALVMYSALAGASLYDGGNKYDRLIKAAEGVGEAEAAKIAVLPKQLQALLFKALQRDPAKRFQSAAEFASAITALGHEVGNLSALHREMERLFGDELRGEQAKLQAHARAATEAGGDDPREVTAKTVLLTQLPGNNAAAVIDESIAPLAVRGIGAVGQVNETLVWQLCL